MHSFKARTGTSLIYEINKNNFERVTEQKSPYYVHNEKNELVQFAVCPICDNPIEIIGLYKRLKNTDLPYGKHCPKSISGLAEYNQQAYDFCPYADKRKSINKNSRKTKLTDFEKNIYCLMREQFDRVIYILSKQLDIRITNNAAKSMLTTYVSGKGWMYPWSTLNNIPWVFGHLSWSKRLYGQPILKNSALYSAILEKCPAANFVPCDKYGGKYDILLSKEGMFLDINYCIIEHNRTVENDKLLETMELVVSEGGVGEGRKIFTKTLTINQKYFLNLINLPKGKSREIISCWKWLRR